MAERDHLAEETPGLARRLLWFVGLWIAGVAVVAAIGLVIKLMLGH